MEQDVDDFPLQLTQRLAHLHHSKDYPDLLLADTQVAFLRPRPHLQYTRVLDVHAYRLNALGQFENGSPWEVSTSAWAQLPCFTALQPEKKVYDYQLRLGQEVYALFPFGFKLSPNLYFISPAGYSGQVGERLSPHRQVISRELTWALSTCLELRFSLQKLATIADERELLLGFIDYLCEILIPIRWHINFRNGVDRQLHNYLTREFSSTSYALLSLDMPSWSVAKSIQFSFPELPALQPLSQNGWQDLNEPEPELLRATLVELYRQLYHRWQDYRQLAPYEQVVRWAEQRLEKIQDELTLVKDQLKQGERMQRAAQRSVATPSQSRYGIYQDRSGHWSVHFDREYIPRLSATGCQYFNFLFARPGETFNVLELRQYFDLPKDARTSQTGQQSFNQKEFNNLMGKLKAERVNAILIQAALEGSPSEFRKLQERIISHRRIYLYIHQHLQGYEDDLQYYNYLYEKYCWEQEADFTQDYRTTTDRRFPNSNRLNTAQCKLANERISKAIGNFRRGLNTAGHIRFHRYTFDVLPRETVDGLHHYTFLPHKSSEPELREIEWVCELPR